MMMKTSRMQIYVHDATACSVHFQNSGPHAPTRTPKKEKKKKEKEKKNRSV